MNSPDLSGKEVVVPTAVEETISSDLGWSAVGTTQAGVGSFSVYEMTIESDEHKTGGDGLYSEEWETQFLQPRTMQDNLREQERKRKEARRKRKQRASKTAEFAKRNEQAPKLIKPKRQRSLQRRTPSPQAVDEPEHSTTNSNGAESRLTSADGSNKLSEAEEQIWNEARRRADRLLSGKTAHQTPPTHETEGEGGSMTADAMEGSKIFNLTRVDDHPTPSSKKKRTKIPKGVALYGLPSVSQIGKSYAKSFDSKGKAEKTAAFRDQNAAHQRAIDSEVVVGREEGSENLLKEIDVIKYICLRERLKGNLITVCRQLKTVCHNIVKKRRGINRPVDSGLVFQVSKQQEIVTTLIHELQRASIAVVTAVTRWRESVYKSQRKRSGPNGTRVTTFRWKGGNYLLAMQKDLRFLSRKRDDRMNRKRLPKRQENRGVLSGGIGGIITTSEPGSESEATLSEKFVDPVAYWLGFEPEKHPLLVPSENLNVLFELQQERSKTETLAAAQLKHEQDTRAAALRAAHMARISGVRAPSSHQQQQKKILLNQSNLDTERARTASPSGSMISVTSDEMNMGEMSKEDELATASLIEAAGPSVVNDNNAVEDDGNEEDEVVVDEPSIPWTFWALDLYNKEPLAKPLPEKSQTLHFAALQVLAHEKEIEKQWRNAEEVRTSPDAGYDPISRIADQGGIDMLLAGVSETKLADDAEVVARLRNRQQNRNLRVADATMRPTHLDRVDAGTVVALGVSTHRVRHTAERAIEDSRPHVLISSPGAPHTKLQGSLLIGELPMNLVRRQNAIVNHAASLIQARCRGVLARGPGGPIEIKRIEREKRKVFAATGLQSLIRGRIARSEVEEIRFNMPTMDPNVAATMIQGLVRTFFARKSMEIERVYLKTVLIAAAAESREAKAKESAAVVVVEPARGGGREENGDGEEEGVGVSVRGRGRRRRPVLLMTEDGVVEEITSEKRENSSKFVERKRAEVESTREKNEE